MLRVNYIISESLASKGLTRLELKNITKLFGGFKAVDSVSISVEDGEFLVLLGPSGSGKTTILRMIAGLDRPTEGSVLLGGRDVTGLSPKERDVAMVFQNYALYPHMSIYDNMALPLKVRGLRKEEIDRKVRDTAELLQITHILNKKPSQISGGEQQRVALGRAIVRNPKVFLFDEPLSNLDAKLRVTTRGFLKRLQKELKVTTVYVTHDQSEAMTMADRIAVLNKGKLLQVSTPTELYKNPADVFVAGFVGSPPMNLIEGRIEKDRSLSFDKTKIKLRSVPIEKGEVIVGVRPEDIIIAERDKDEVIQGRIYVSEPMGNVQYITIDVNGIKLVAQAEADFRAEINQPISFFFREKAIHFFSKETGQRLNCSLE
jgi:multiple sugar transport system ATP-binding protein